MGKLSGKVAIVTGASKGIGASIARALGAAGASVVVNYSSSKEEAEGVVAEIRGREGKAVAVQGDVAKSEDVKRIFADTVAAFGPPSILVNNAGVFRFGPLEEANPKEFRRQFGVNVIGTLLMSQEAASHAGPEGASIINVGSVVGQNPMPGQVIYASTKAAVDSITRVLATELGPRKIRVNALNPGATRSPGTDAIDLFTPEVEERMKQRTALGRLGEPDDMGPTAVFLASDDSAWITGETIRVSGGMR